jgi:hypothetical protein
MNRTQSVLQALIIAIVLGSFLAPGSQTQAQQSQMTFFITSAGMGNGGNLGGLEGADKHCQTLAAAAGAGNRTWRAYLSSQAAGGGKSVSARDRIGKGPWQNAKGIVVATSVEDLHGPNNKLSKENSLNEKGGVVNGRGDKPNTHDILTGSTADGRAFTDGQDHTCSNWTASGDTGGAGVGHHDRQGGGQDPTSWNAAHTTPGCGQPNLVKVGGAGLFYCFAAN